MGVRLGALLFCALLAAAAATLVGGTWIAPDRIARALLHHGDATTIAIVWQLRVPRIAIGALVGAALPAAGALLQALLRNPLVDPFLTGVSAGAALAVVAGMAAGLSAALLPFAGFAAGLATAVAVALLARRGSGLDATRLILAGVSISSLFSAIIALILTRWQTGASAPAIVGWLAGSLSGRGWPELVIALPYVAAGAAIALGAVPALNAMRIGETRAASVGVDVAAAQWMVLAAASLLTAASVTLSGTVGFVGLLVPHVARRLVGSDLRFVLPASAMLGAAVLILADAICRSAFAPTEIPIGVLLAFAGVPAFLYLYLNDAQRAAS